MAFQNKVLLNFFKGLFLLMDSLKLILDGIREGDKNGGPTELAKILTSSLIESNGFNKNDLIKRYYQWFNTGAFDTGPTFEMVFQKVSQGVSIENAVIQVNDQLKGATAGCAPAHRISPLAGFSVIPTHSLIDLARQEAKITHYHPDAGNCSAIMVLLCRHLLEENSWKEAKKLVSENIELKETWKKIMNAELNKGGYVLNVMHSAIHFLDDDNSLEKSLNFAGPANYCPVIVGIIDKIRKNYD